MRYLLVLLLLVLGSAVRAAPLLTKQQIAKAAAKIEACLEKKLATKGRQLDCVGIIQGRCDDAISAGGEAAHATCADNETAAWDVLLNKAWSDLPAFLGPARFAALKEIQKKWLDYRDAKCAFLNDMDNMGSWGLMLKAQCKLDETARRTIELREILADANFAAR